MTDTFYYNFEQHMRGSRSLIKSRLEVYIPFLKPFIKASNENELSAIDLGCGRGEMLEIFQAQGFSAIGVDADQKMIDECVKQGFQVRQKDITKFLLEQDDESVDVISCIHVAEHLLIDTLKDVIRQIYRVLKPGGILIVETPNPENLVVGVTDFYVDPTHKRPIPPELLCFLVNNEQFKRNLVLRLNGNKKNGVDEEITLNDVILGVSPDYSVVAQKNGSSDLLKKFDEVFTTESGSPLRTVVAEYDYKIQSAIDAINEKILNHMSQFSEYVESNTITKDFLKILEDRENELRGLEVLLAKHENENIRLTEKVDSLSIENRRLSEVENDLKYARFEHSRLASELDQVWNEKEKFRRDLQVVYASKSWRMTKLPRFISSVIRRLFLRIAYQVVKIRGYIIIPINRNLKNLLIGMIM